MKKVHVGLALVVVAVLLALWVVRSSSGISEVPRTTQTRRSRPEPAPELNLPAMPLRVPPSGASPVHPLEKPTPSPGSEAPADPSAELRKRIAALKRTSRDPAEIEREAIRATAEFLSIQPASRSAFEEEARQSVLELELALAALKADLAVLAEKQQTPVAAGDARRLAEARYAAARRNALDRLQPFLSGCTNAKEFQWGFDSWAATVSARAQDVNSLSGGK